MNVSVEQLAFEFDPRIDPFQYERGGATVPEWPVGRKVVDVVASDPADTPLVVWLIEAKDFRVITNPPKPANLSGLPATINAKVRATVSSLPIVATAITGSAAAVHALHATSVTQYRVVLHLEPHSRSGANSALFPRGFAASVLQKLQALVRDIDSAPLVLNIARTPGAGVPWTVL